MKLALVLTSSLLAGLGCGMVVRSYQIINERTTTTAVITNVVTNTVRTIIQPPVTNIVLAQQSEPFHWRQIASSSLKQYIANLRAVGCPEPTVRDIVLAIITRQFAPQLAALSPQPQPYWKTRRQYFANVDQAKEIAALEQQRQTLLKDLLGYETKTGDHRGYQPETEDQFAFLSPDRHAALGDALKRVREQQEQRIRDYRAELVTVKGTTDGSEYELAAKWREIQKDGRAELARLLTSDELEQYDLRHSDTARTLRSTLSGFDPAPDEFREVFRLQQALNDQFGENSNRNPTEERRAAEQQMQTLLKDKLGEQRFAEYERSQNFDYQTLVRAVDQYNVDPDMPNEAWSLRDAAQAERQWILAQASLTPEQQKAALEQLTSATRQQLTTLMGDAAFVRYERWRGSRWWLNELAKPTVTRSVP